MDAQASSTPPVLSTERKAELFDKFVLKLVPHAGANYVVKYLMAMTSIEEVFDTSEHEAVINDFLEPFADEEVREILKIILPKILEVDLGARRISIEW